MTEPNDLIARLQLVAAWRKPGGPTPTAKMPSTYKACTEAAAEIERLRGEVAGYVERGRLG